MSISPTCVQRYIMLDAIKRWLERILEVVSISLLVTMAVIVVLAVVFRFIGKIADLV